VDPEATTLAGVALTRAVDSLTSSGPPLRAFALLDNAGEQSMVPQASAADARSFASQAGVDCAALGTDARIPFEGASHRAIVIEAWNFRTHDGAALALRYGLRGRRVILLGGPLELAADGWVDRAD